MSTYAATSRRPIAEVFRATANGVTALCVRLGVHPDAISYASMVAAAGAGACFLFSGQRPWLVVPGAALCYLRLWMNMLDGMVAIASGKASLRGELLNDLPDRVSDVLIFAGVAHSGLCLVPLGYWAAIMALITAYVGLFGQAVNVGRQFGGVMSKPWRMVVLHMGTWIAALVLWRSGGAGPWLNIALGIIIGGCVQTIAVRLSSIMRGLWINRHDARVADAPPGPEPASVGEPAVLTFTAHDGAELLYRAWIPALPTEKVLVMFHRGHEHSGRLVDVVEAMGLTDVAVFAWDARGHGKSPGKRGYAESFAAMVRDADTFVKHVCRQHGYHMRQVIVLAHSVGAVTATAWVHDYAPPIRGLVLVTPALRVRLYVPLAIPGLRVLLRWRGKGNAFIKSYVKAKMLTHDPVQAQRYQDDPLIERSIAVNILLGLHDAGTRLIDDAGAIRVPTLMLCGGADWVVDVGAQQQFFERLGSVDKRVRVFDGMYHDLLHEAKRHLVIDEVRRFVLEKYRQDSEPDDRRDADLHGFTREEYERLCKRLPMLSAKGVLFLTQRLAMNTIGRLSAGIRVGYATGFDSGKSLEYVYRDEAKGSLVVGKWIDRAYLDSVGWRGIRVRREHLRDLIGEAIEHAYTKFGRVHLLEVAAGCGRYTLEVIRDAEAPVTALLRDYTPANLDEGRQLATEMGVKAVTFEQADAFAADSYHALEPMPNIAVISGLFELFPSNAPIRSALSGVASVVPAGGFLVYTNQPWHPQVEFIGRVLPNRDGKPWIMRRRTQREMDQLVEAVGFEKLDMRVDDFGIFTVSIACKREGV